MKHYASALKWSGNVASAADIDVSACDVCYNDYY